MNRQQCRHHYLFLGDLHRLPEDVPDDDLGTGRCGQAALVGVIVDQIARHQVPDGKRR